MNYTEFLEGKKMHMEIMKKYDRLEEFMSALDTCFDLYELGYCSQEEQRIWEEMSELSALEIYGLWVESKK
uniref:Uncharacterized protein n=1 Tax=Bacillus phage Jabberwock TaxID=3163548 RepID=A0AAU8EGX0_9CAUD